MKKRLFIAGAILLGLYIRRKNRTRRAGWTLFKATGIKTELVHLDIKQQQATGIVSFKGQISMRVMLDLKEGTARIEGTIEGLERFGIDQDAYVDMFKQQAEFFIENQISDHDKYYADLFAQQKQAAGS